MTHKDEGPRSDHQNPQLPYAIHPRVVSGAVHMSIIYNGEMAHDIRFTPEAARMLGAEFFQCAAEAEEQAGQ